MIILHFTLSTNYVLLLVILLLLLIILLGFIKSSRNNKPLSIKDFNPMHNQYKNLVQNAVDLIFETDNQGRFTFANDFTIEHLGYPFDEIIGRPFTDFIRGDYKERLTAFYQDLMKSEKNFPSIEFPIIRKDGSEIWGSQKVIVLRDSEGKIVGYSGIVRDITALKRLEIKEKKRIKKFNKFNKTINYLSSANFSQIDNFTDVLKIILKQTAIATKTNIVSYWNYENEQLSSHTSYELLKDEFSTKIVEENQFLQSNFELLKQQKIIIIPDLKSDSNSFFEKYSIVNPEINSMLIMSVLHDGILMGVLCFANKKSNRIWDNEDTNFIRTIIDVISIRHELQLRLETELKLNYTSHLWSVISKCTEQFLISKSTYEMFADTFHAIGLATNVDHIFYYENNLQTQIISQKYKWAKQNIQLQITPLRTFTHEDFYQILELAKNKKPFIASTDKIEDSLLKNLLVNNEIKSIIIIPLFLFNEFSGFIGFDSCSYERTWTGEEINIFQVLANTISSVIERSTTEKLVNESEERFRLLANNIPGTVYLSKFDEKWTKIYLNDQIELLTGYPKSAFIDDKMSFSELLHEEDKDAIVVNSVEKILSGETLHFTYRIRKKDGTIVWVEEFADVIKTGNTIDFIEGIFIDITAKKEAENAVLEKELAQSANKAKSQFLANMSHEIKTPLNGIIGFTDLLMETDLNFQQLSYMTTVHQSANTLLGIINDILDFSKIEAGKLELDLQVTSLQELMDSIRQVIRFDLEQKKLNLSIEINDNVPKHLLIDNIRLKQILLNLVSNAIKFTAEGRITIRIECKKRIDYKTQQIRFSVIDTGIGILEVNQKRIFEPFLQEDNSTTRKYGGTGLGLTITNQLLQLMQSKLKVKSKPNEGSNFYFDLILTENKVLETKELTIKDEVLNYDTSQLKMKILIVEDNKINMLLIKTILKSLFPLAQLLESVNGEEAIEMFVNSKPDIILMDVQMPILNGIEATKKIRTLEEEDSKIPIIALTAGTLKEERELCLSSGMSDFVSKPVVKDTIKEVILKWTKT